MKRTIFLGTYTKGESKGIYSCRFDDATGALTDFRLAAETPSPSFLALHPNGKFLYAVNETDNYGGETSGAVTAYRIADGEGGVLKKLNAVSSHGAHPCHLVLTPGAKAVIIANYTGSTVATIEIKADGSLGRTLNRIVHKGSGLLKPRQADPHPHAVNLDPANRFVFISDLGMDQIVRYELEENGQLSKSLGSTKVDPGTGPRHFAFHPGANFGYVLNEITRTITAFRYNAASGELTEIQTISTVPEGWARGSTAEIFIHPNGRFLYSSNRGHDSIACFNIHQGCGKLSLIEIEKTGGRTPRNFNLDPSGRWIIAANQSSGDLQVFSIDQKTGALEPTAAHLEIPAPVCVVFL